MKYLLPFAICCAGLATLIIAAPPARSQTSKSSCPPPYYWVDVNKLSPLARKSLRPVNGKVKMLNPPCVEYEQLMKNIKDIRNMPPASADEYDIITCEFKTQRCTRKPYPLPLPPGTLPRRIPLNADPLNPQSKRSRSSIKSPVLGRTQKGRQAPPFNGIFDPNDLKIVNNTKIQPWSPRAKLISTFASINASIQCSGTNINSRHLLTAAHCIYAFNPNTKQFLSPTSIEVFPGLNGTSKPWTFTGTAFSSSNLSSYQNWISRGNSILAYQFDMAVVRLNPEVLREPGWLNFFALSNPIGLQARLAGYPNDTSILASQSNFLHTATGRYQRYLFPGEPRLSRVVAHRISGVSGMSGGSMTTQLSPNDSHSITGLFVGDSKDEQGRQWNIAMALDQEIISLINDLIKLSQN